jgi:hypothetical protein
MSRTICHCRASIRSDNDVWNAERENAQVRKLQQSTVEESKPYITLSVDKSALRRREFATE